MFLCFICNTICFLLFSLILLKTDTGIISLGKNYYLSRLTTKLTEQFKIELKQSNETLQKINVIWFVFQCDILRDIPPDQVVPAFHQRYDI